jgi:hypothetical protein
LISKKAQPDSIQAILDRAYANARGITFFQNALPDQEEATLMLRNSLVLAATDLEFTPLVERFTGDTRDAELSTYLENYVRFKF